MADVTFTEHLVPNAQLAPARLAQIQMKIDNAWQTIGLLQSVTFNFNQNMERVAEIGYRFSVPIGGFKFFTLTARRALFDTPNLLQLWKGGNTEVLFQLDEIIENRDIRIVFDVDSPPSDTGNYSKRCFDLLGVSVTSHNIAVQAGMIVIYEDVTMEAQGFSICTAG